MKFDSIKRKTVEGKGIVVLVRLSEEGKPTDVLGKRISVDGKFYTCTGMESRGPARAGDLVCLIIKPYRKGSK